MFVRYDELLFEQVITAGDRLEPPLPKFLPDNLVPVRSVAVAEVAKVRPTLVGDTEDPFPSRAEMENSVPGHLESDVHFDRWDFRMSYNLAAR
jgi:hypothetical protein